MSIYSPRRSQDGEAAPTAYSHSWVLPGTFHDATKVRRLVRTELDGLPVSHEVELVVTELANNAIRHTRSGRGTFTVLLDWQPTRVCVAVADEGALTAPRLVPGSPHDAENGRGLLIVAATASRWGVHGDHDGHTVYAEFDTAPDGQRPPEAAHVC